MQNPVITKQQEGLDKLQRKNKLSIHTDVKADTYEEKSAHLIYGNKLFLENISIIFRFLSTHHMLARQMNAGVLLLSKDKPTFGPSRPGWSERIKDISFNAVRR